MPSRRTPTAAPATAVVAAAASPASATPAATPAAVKSPKAAKPSQAPQPDKAAKPAKPVKAGKVEKAVKADKPAKPVKPPKPAKPVKPEKAPKLRQRQVRDSFTMPEADHGLIATLKARALASQHAAKKSELLRAGLHVLAAMDTPTLIRTLKQLDPIKLGRPGKPA